MICTIDTLSDIRTRNEDRTIAYTNGCFDILHTGHLSVLQRCKIVGDIAVVGITPDAVVKQKKGNDRPIQNQHARAALIDAFRYVDYTVITPEFATGFKFIGQYVLDSLRPDYFITLDPLWENDSDWLAERGIELILHQYQPDHPSTSSIIERITGMSG